MKENSKEDIKILEEKMNKELDFLIENANKTEQLTAISIIAMKEPIILLFLSILSDYKRVLKENEELKNIELKSKGGAIKISLDGVLSLENKIKQLEKENKELKLYNNSITSQLEQMTTEKFKNGWFHQSEFKGLIPVQKVKDKIKKEIKYHEKNILDIENITMLKSKTAKEEAEIEFNKYAIVVLHKMLEELLEGRK